MLRLVALFLLSFSLSVVVVVLAVPQAAITQAAAVLVVTDAQLLARTLALPVAQNPHLY
jgi:hypothetical protein